jgi:hypothetical protein
LPLAPGLVECCGRTDVEEEAVVDLHGTGSPDQSGEEIHADVPG